MNIFSKKKAVTMWRLYRGGYHHTPRTPQIASYFPSSFFTSSVRLSLSPWNASVVTSNM